MKMLNPLFCLTFCVSGIVFAADVPTAEELIAIWQGNSEKLGTYKVEFTERTELHLRSLDENADKAEWHAQGETVEGYYSWVESTDDKFKLTSIKRPGKRATEGQDGWNFPPEDDAAAFDGKLLTRVRGDEKKAWVKREAADATSSRFIKYVPRNPYCMFFPFNAKALPSKNVKTPQSAKTDAAGRVVRELRVPKSKLVVSTTPEVLDGVTVFKVEDWYCSLKSNPALTESHGIERVPEFVLTRYFVDPKRGWMPVKTEYYVNKGALFRTTVVEDAVLLPNGAWFPMQGRVVEYVAKEAALGPSLPEGDRIPKITRRFAVSRVFPKIDEKVFNVTNEFDLVDEDTGDTYTKGTPWSVIAEVAPKKK